MTSMDWTAWNNRYDDPSNWLVQRLRTVQHQLDTALTEALPGPISIISVCAGQGRDLIEVLATHHRLPDVTAVLVELDLPSVQAGQELARAANVASRVDLRAGDASNTDAFLDCAPADVVLVCGVFGNITDSDIEGFIKTHLTALTRTNGTVIWTRTRRAPDLVPDVCRWFADASFQQQWLSDPDLSFGVGRHTFLGEATTYRAGQPMFTFVGYDVLAARRPTN